MRRNLLGSTHRFRLLSHRIVRSLQPLTPQTSSERLCEIRYSCHIFHQRNNLLRPCLQQLNEPGFVDHDLEITMSSESNLTHFFFTQCYGRPKYLPRTNGPRFPAEPNLIQFSHPGAETHVHFFALCSNEHLFVPSPVTALRG